MERDQLQRAVARLRRYGTVVFDLDGTLVRLQVDWQEAQADLSRIARRFGKEAEGRSIWTMLREATEEEAAALNDALNIHEMRGSSSALALPASAVLLHLRPERVGVVTLNCRACAEEALRVTGLTAFVGAVVAREDTARLKPDPEPLLRCIDRLKGSPGRTVFVGDRERDRETAEAAGTGYLSVHNLLRME